MNEFSHIRLIVGFILSLSLGTLLRGIARLIVHPKRHRFYWVHLLWVLYLFLTLVYFWWWEYALQHIAVWTFSAYALIISYILLLYLCCYLLFPDDLAEYKDYRTYYFDRLPWFFAVLSATLLIDVADTYLKRSTLPEHSDGVYLAQTALLVCLCGLAVRVKNDYYHAGLALLLITHTVVWISRQYVFI